MPRSGQRRFAWRRRPSHRHSQRCADAANQTLAAATSLRAWDPIQRGAAQTTSRSRAPGAKNWGAAGLNYAQRRGPGAAHHGAAAAGAGRRGRCARAAHHALASVQPLVTADGLGGAVEPALPVGAAQDVAGTRPRERRWRWRRRAALAAIGGPNMQANMLSAMLQLRLRRNGGRGADAPIAQAEGGRRSAKRPPCCLHRQGEAPTTAYLKLDVGAARGADGGAGGRSRPSAAGPGAAAAHARPRRDQPRGGEAGEGLGRGQGTSWHLGAHMTTVRSAAAAAAAAARRCFPHRRGRARAARPTS